MVSCMIIISLLLLVVLVMVSCMIIISLLLLVYSSSNGLMYDYY